VHIGTSGWHYRQWRGPFYPRNLPPVRFLSYYAQHLQSVEINNTFYGPAKKETLAQWRDAVGAGFLFSVKASRYITHYGKLKNPEPHLASFLEALGVLGEKVGVVLFQLPPRWRCNTERLSSFLALLPPGYRYAFEFRDRSWFRREVYEVLRLHGAALCMYELAGFVSPKEVTADFVYVRLHGPGEAYRGRYEVKTLAAWAAALSRWAGQGRTVYCYFDNDEQGFAVENALELQGMMG
jgi:uncharacterized protein YecE (DUF72 family)